MKRRTRRILVRLFEAAIIVALFAVGFFRILRGCGAYR